MRISPDTLAIESKILEHKKIQKEGMLMTYSAVNTIWVLIGAAFSVTSCRRDSPCVKPDLPEQRIQEIF